MVMQRDRQAPSKVFVVEAEIEPAVSLRVRLLGLREERRGCSPAGGQQGLPELRGQRMGGDRESLGCVAR